MVLNINAQTEKEERRIDSLRQLLSTDLVDTTRFKTTSFLVDYFYASSLDSAKKYACENVKLAEQMEKQLYLVNAWNKLTQTYIYAGNLDSLEYAYQQTLCYLKGCKSDQCRRIYIRLQTNYAAIFNGHGQYQKAITLLSSLLDEPDLTANEDAIARLYLSQCYREVGDYDAALAETKKARIVDNENLELFRLSIIDQIYYVSEQWHKAEESMKKTLAYGRKLNQLNSIQNTLYTLADLYVRNNKVDEARPLFKELLSISNKNTGNGMYVSALVGLLKTTDVNAPEATQYVEAIKSILNSNQSFRSIHIRSGIYTVLVDYYLKSKHVSLAEQYAQKHLNFLRLHQTDTAELTVNAFQNLSQTQAAIGKYEAAWHTLDTFHQLKMAMVNRTQADAMAQMSVEMDLAENELARQKAEQATLVEQQALANRTRMFIFVLVVVALVLGGIVWAYRRAERDKQLINEKKQLIEQSLAEKEVLLREIHHRVKNNLQIISSLLDKQARKSSDEVVKQLVKQGQERIQSMALIHQNLYQSEQLSGIDIKSYLLELIENIQKSQSAKTVEVELNIDQIKLDIDTAIPVGLILNELLTNSYKYAFVDQQTARVHIDFKKEEKSFLLQVSDNGIGFSSEQAAAKSKSLGLNLVRGLVRQLEGSMEWLDVKQGASVLIRF